MEKSRHYYRNSMIEFSELHNFIEPVRANICIPYASVINNMIDKSDYSTEAYIADVFNELINENIPTLRRKMMSMTKRQIACVTYNTHIDGYDFRFNPIDIVNRIFKYLELDYSIPFINLDNTFGMEYFKDYVRSYMNDIRRTCSVSEKVAIIEEVNANIDKICDVYYNTKINGYMERNCIPKDALFYLAYSSLGYFEETGDINYLVFAKEYYDHVSHMRTSQYPHRISMDGYSRVWFEDYRFKYESILDKPEIDIEKLKLTDDEVLLAWDILKPGMVEREIRDAVAKTRASSNVDYEKYQKLFEMKMNYYLSSPYYKFIQGKYGLNGYVGFSYRNDYLLFDKFHNSETIDPSRKTVLTHPEAIFALPADRFGLISGKQVIIDAKKEDSRIKKINHTSNGSFINKLDGIVKGPNVSTMSFDEALEQEKKRILIKRK